MNEIRWIGLLWNEGMEDGREGWMEGGMDGESECIGWMVGTKTVIEWTDGCYE